MRLASVVTSLAALLSAQALACSCVIPAPMAGERNDAYVARRWTFNLNPTQFSNVFIATVTENIGRYLAMTERDGDWPLKLTDVEILAGRAPPDGVVHNDNSCWAFAPVGSRIVVRTDDKFIVGMCTVDVSGDVPLGTLKDIIARKYPPLRRKE